jgi:polyhydroxyalkanoate synthesis regulator phasin
MSENSSMTEENRSAREKMSDGIRQGIGVLNAFKDALEETIQEARERGDLSPERARAVVNRALDRAQEAAGEARERLDFATRKEFEELRGAVLRLKEQVDGLEARVRGNDGSGWTASSDEPAPDRREDEDFADKADPGPSD